MRHFVVYPSAKPEIAIVCAEKWTKAGYSVHVMLDKGVLGASPWCYFVNCQQDRFPGYYRVINELVAQAFKRGADLVTCIGDDMLPPHEAHAEAVALMYFSKFPDGFGVMQATGDPQGKDDQGVQAAARICGSPTFGRGWFERGYGGKGPFCEEYRSFYSDEDLWNVARKSEVLYLEPRLTIFHNHWSWGHMKKQEYHNAAQNNWGLDKLTFERRQKEGFPGWEPK